MALPTGWLTAFTTILTFGVGLAFKYTLDAKAQRNDAARKFALENRTAFLQQQLTRFYWPLYLVLEKDDLIYERVTERDEDPNSNASRLSIYIEANSVLPNHQAAAKVIEDFLYLAGDHEVVTACVAYIRHVKVFEMLSAAGVKTDPINQGAPYPKGFKDIVRRHCMKIQTEYDQMIGQGVMPTAR
jgi:hypothetical protein